VKTETEVSAADAKKKSRRGIIKSFIGAPIMLVLLLGVSGNWEWFQAYLLSGVYMLFAAVYAIVLHRLNPELLVERTKFLKPDTKRFDKFFFAAWRPLVLAVLVVAGLDVRYGWTDWPNWLVAPAIFAQCLFFSFSLWALVVNRHFEVTVRIQADRDHAVCSAGPYRYVRHPGYVGAVVLAMLDPLVLGSKWALVPALGVAVAFIVRTALEDRTLHKELEGYAEYARSTDCRLLPGVW